MFVLGREDMGRGSSANPEAHIAQAMHNLGLLVLLTPECCNYRSVPLGATDMMLRIGLRALFTLSEHCTN